MDVVCAFFPFFLQDEMEEEHPYTKNSKKRFLVQSTKKMDCKSQITLKAVVKFPDFKVNYSFSFLK